MLGWARDLKCIKQLGKIIWDVFINFLYQCVRNRISPTKCNNKEYQRSRTKFFVVIYRLQNVAQFTFLYMDQDYHHYLIMNTEIHETEIKL